MECHRVFWLGLEGLSLRAWLCRVDTSHPQPCFQRLWSDRLEGESWGFDSGADKPWPPSHSTTHPSTHSGTPGETYHSKILNRNVATPGTKVNYSVSSQWSSPRSNPHPRTLLHLMRNISAKCSGHHLLSILLAYFPARTRSRPSLSCELTGGDKPGRARLIQPGWPGSMLTRVCQNVQQKHFWII